MRPRVIPAEDAEGMVSAGMLPRASMRPRVIPAEDDPRAWPSAPRTVASMRPRVIPAEDDGVSPACSGRRRCFNEAAGNPRGRLARCAVPLGDRSASMRPRVIPAEDMTVDVGLQTFLAASMRPRVIPAEDVPRMRFNWNSRRLQ